MFIGTHQTAMTGVESVYWDIGTNEIAMTRVESVYWDTPNSHNGSRECLSGQTK